MQDPLFVIPKLQRNQSCEGVRHGFGTILGFAGQQIYIVFGNTQLRGKFFFRQLLLLNYLIQAAAKFISFRPAVSFFNASSLSNLF